MQGDLVSELLQEINQAEAEPQTTTPEVESLALTAQIDQLEIDMAGLQTRYKQLTIEARQLAEKEHSINQRIEAHTAASEQQARRLKQLSTAHDNATQIIASHDEAIALHDERLTLCATQLSTVTATVRSQAAQLVKLKKDRCTLTQILLGIIAFGAVGMLFINILDSSEYNARLQRIEQHFYP